MTHVHKLSGHKLRLIEQRDNGSGLFADDTGHIVCDMKMVQDDRPNITLTGGSGTFSIPDRTKFRIKKEANHK